MREQVKFWRSPQFPTLDLLHAHYITHAFSRHIHDTFAIGIILMGAESFCYRGENHVAEAGRIVFVNPDEVHTGHAATDDGWTYRMFYPEVSLLQQAAIELSDRPQSMLYFPQAVVTDPTRWQLLLHLHRTLERQTSRLEQESLLLWGLAQLIAHHASDRLSTKPPGRESAAIRQVREHLETHFAENPSLAELAAIAHLSSFYLLRSFRQQVGLPPHEYLTQVRLQHAKHLLGQGYNLSEIAHCTGFADQSHFTRKFRRMTGVTPGQYQKGQFCSSHCIQPTETVG